MINGALNTVDHSDARFLVTVSTDVLQAHQINMISFINLCMTIIKLVSLSIPIQTDHKPCVVVKDRFRAQLDQALWLS